MIVVLGGYDGGGAWCCGGAGICEGVKVWSRMVIRTSLVIAHNSLGSSVIDKENTLLAWINQSI